MKTKDFDFMWIYREKTCFYEQLTQNFLFLFTTKSKLTNVKLQIYNRCTTHTWVDPNGCKSCTNENNFKKIVLLYQRTSQSAKLFELSNLWNPCLLGETLSQRQKLCSDKCNYAWSFNNIFFFYLQLCKSSK